MRALAKERADRFDSVAAFVKAAHGEVGAAEATRIGSAMVGVTATAELQPAPGAERMAAAPAITTFSRATSEVEVSADDEAPLALARSRRWPLVALGGLAGAGLALFLLMRPSPGPTPRAAAPTPAVAVPASQAAAPPAAQPPPQAGAVPSPVFLGVPDAGAAAAPSAAEQPVRRRSATASGLARTVSAAQPSPAAAERRRQVTKKRSTEDDWVLH